MSIARSSHDVPVTSGRRCNVMPRGRMGGAFLSFLSFMTFYCEKSNVREEKCGETYGRRKIKRVYKGLFRGFHIKRHVISGREVAV